jgi:hypothetical protein
MSGYGIDVFKLVESCGWPAKLNAREAEAEGESTSWLAGLVMIGPGRN